MHLLTGTQSAQVNKPQLNTLVLASWSPSNNNAACVILCTAGWGVLYLRTSLHSLLSTRTTSHCKRWRRSSDANTSTAVTKMSYHIMYDDLLCAPYKIQTWICAPGTHYGWVDQSNVECEVEPTFTHMTGRGNRTQEILTWVQWPSHSHCSLILKFSLNILQIDVYSNSGVLGIYHTMMKITSIVSYSSLRFEC